MILGARSSERAPFGWGRRPPPRRRSRAAFERERSFDPRDLANQPHGELLGLRQRDTLPGAPPTACEPQNRGIPESPGTADSVRSVERSSQALALTELIYRAALDAARWDEFVRGLSRAYDDAAVGFALQLPGYPLSGVFYAVGFHEDYRDRFAAHVLRGLPWEPARVKNFVGRFGLASEVIPDTRLVETDFYSDWMAPQGLPAHGPIGHTIALDGGRPIAGIAIFPAPNRGPFARDDLALGNLLVPHLALAYQIQGQMRRSHALTEAIDRYPTGVALIDARGQLVLMNRGARVIFEQSDGLSLHDATPHAERPAENKELRRILTAAIDAARTGANPVDNVMSVSRSSGARAYPLMAAPLRPATGDPTLSDAVAVLYVADLESGTVRRREVLGTLYGLTQAETELVELLCQGHSLETAAETRGVTMNTTRSQLKQVFSKTSTSRQGELVRLVMSGVASISGP